MKILDVKSLVFPEVKVIKFHRFGDERGYFTETFRKSDLKKILPEFEINQINESASSKGVIRGVHFQWNPYMAKLVRTVTGHMIDLFMDIRIGSPNFGKIAGYSMPNNLKDSFNEWIYIPVGFAHGNIYLEDSRIEYFCTSEYSPATEAGISPVSPDIDWSMADKFVKDSFDKFSNSPTMSPKDKAGLTLAQWKTDERNKYFIYR